MLQPLFLEQVQQNKSETSLGAQKLLVDGRGGMAIFRWGWLLAGYSCPSREAHTHVLCAVLIRCSGYFFFFKKGLKLGGSYVGDKRRVGAMESGWI